MSLAVRQMFPRREGGRIVHKEWTPDLGCAQRINRFGTRKAGRLVREVEEMAQHFPRWLLSVAIDRKLVRCAKCKGMLVFDRGLRCVECETARSVDRLSNRVRLAYFGLMPPIGIDGLRRVKKGLGSRAPRQHVVGRATEIGSYLLVPLVASFPNDYPNSPVAVAYLPGFFQIPGTPAEGPSHTVHMLSGGFMCLFAARQWRQTMTCREVLQQRAYPHVIKLLNYANGKGNAFAIVT